MAHLKPKKGYEDLGGPHTPESDEWSRKYSEAVLASLRAHVPKPPRGTSEQKKTD
jgi:hypothetical protein